MGYFLASSLQEREYLNNCVIWIPSYSFVFLFVKNCPGKRSHIKIYVNTQTRQAYLTYPCCYNCKTNLLTRTNSKSNGFDLECTDCKKTFNVDDILEKKDLLQTPLSKER
jgi:hypothetical protein